MFLKDFISKDEYYLTKENTLFDVIEIMSINKLHFIVIVDDQKPIGIITERDIVRFYSNNINLNELAIDHFSDDLVLLHNTRLVDYALSMMINNNIRKIIIVDHYEHYIGCAEQEDLIFCLEDKIEEEAKTLNQLTHAGNKAVLINPTTTLKHALEIMYTNKLTSLLVIDNEKAIGIISESDIIRLAHTKVDQNEAVVKHMHSPVVEIDEYKTAEDMIKLMQTKKIRRVVVFNTKDEQYYTLTSKDIAAIIKGNYTNFLENKIFDTRDTFNALSEYVIELLDFDNEQVIYWANSITKANFNVMLDDSITKIINIKTWKKLYKTLMETHIIFETIKIEDRYYQIKGHYGSITNDVVIKLFLNDITEIMELNQKLEEEIALKNKMIFDQSKMVQMGEMIGNIAHQWRQPLSVISTISSGVIYQKEYGLLDETKLITNMENIIDSTNYLSQTIDTFRNFIKEKKEYKSVDIHESIKKSLDLTISTLKNNQIELQDNIDYSNKININMVSGELEQVIINIINNAKDALIENTYCRR